MFYIFFRFSSIETSAVYLQIISSKHWMVRVCVLNCVSCRLFHFSIQLMSNFIFSLNIFLDACKISNFEQCNQFCEYEIVAQRMKWYITLTQYAKQFWKWSRLDLIESQSSTTPHYFIYLRNHNPVIVCYITCIHYTAHAYYKVYA